MSRFLPHDAMPPLDGSCDQQSVGLSGETGQSSRTGLEHRRDDLSHLRGNEQSVQYISLQSWLNITNLSSCECEMQLRLERALGFDDTCS